MSDGGWMPPRTKARSPEGVSRGQDEHSVVQPTGTGVLFAKQTPCAFGSGVKGAHNIHALHRPLHGKGKAFADFLRAYNPTEGQSIHREGFQGS